MDLSVAYIQLLNLFLEKRDIKKGGVQGYDSTFVVTIEDLRRLGISIRRASGMLDVLVMEKVWIKDEDGDKHRVKVLEGYQVATDGGSIKIIDCSTEKIKQCIKKINSKVRYSSIRIHIEAKTARWEDKPISFHKNGWEGFYCLHQNFPDTADYYDLWNSIYRQSGRMAEPPYPILKKMVQSNIERTIRRMREKGFPENVITPVRDKGYRLNL